MSVSPDINRDTVNVDRWREFYTRLEKEIPAQFFEIFFNDIKPLEWNDEKLVLSSPDKKILAHIQNRYLNVISSFAREISHKDIRVQFQFVEKSEEAKAAARPRRKSENRSPNQLDIFSEPVASAANRSLPYSFDDDFKTFLNPNYTFERFVVGPSNEFAYEAARGVARNPRQYHNPLYLFGGVGLGKTHLMMAIGNYMVSEDPSMRVLYVPAETFQNDIYESVEKKTSALVKKYRNVDVLLIDDIQFIRERAKYTQEQIFHIFNHLYQNNKQIIISGDRPPQQLATLKDRLVSRFQSGLIVDIKPPSMETREAILKSKSNEMGMELPSEVIRFIATHAKGQVRLLEAVLIKIKFSSQLKKRRVDMSLASEVVRESSIELKPQIGVEEIIREVSLETSIKADQILGKSRIDSIVFARHIAMYLVRKSLPSMTLLDIANAFGRNDHTTVMNAEKKIRQRLDLDNDFKATIDKLTDIIMSKTV